MEDGGLCLFQAKMQGQKMTPLQLPTFPLPIFPAALSVSSIRLALPTQFQTNPDESSNAGQVGFFASHPPPTPSATFACSLGIFAND